MEQVLWNRVLDKSRENLRKGQTAEEIQKRITAKYPGGEEDAATILAEAQRLNGEEDERIRIEEEKRQADKQRAEAAQSEIEIAALLELPNVLVIEDTEVLNEAKLFRFEARLRERMPEYVLDKINAELSKKSGRLTYREISAIAIIHVESVRNNPGGASPFSRFRNLCKVSPVVRSKLDNRQIRYAISILSTLGLTGQIKQHEKPKWITKPDGQYVHQKGQAAQYILLHDRGWDDVIT